MADHEADKGAVLRKRWCREHAFGVADIVYYVVKKVSTYHFQSRLVKG